MLTQFIRSFNKLERNLILDNHVSWMICFLNSHGVEEPLEVLVGLVLVHQDVQLVDQLALNLEKGSNEMDVRMA